jgi:LysM repeat protein
LIAMGNKPDNSNETWVRNKEKGNDRNTAIVTPAVTIEQPRKIIYPSGVFKINETKVVYIPKGTSYLAIAQQYDVQLNRLFEFNDMRPQEVAMNDQLVYLQRKRRTGANELHTVTDGETLYDIAQTEGIRIENLLAYNFLNGNMQPQVGEKLYLHQKAPAMPRLATAAAIVTVVSKSNDFAKAPVQENEAKFVMHKVQPKETMYSIAKKYGVTPEDIVQWNDLASKDLKIGQQLRIKRI